MDPATDEDAYVYLFGLYLGDGYLSLGRRGVWRLRVTLDQRYPVIIGRAMDAVDAVRRRPAGLVSRVGCVDVSSYWVHWTCALPQHGLGTKHERPIVLHAWQRDAIKRHPGAFLAGLIHSDGCRVINRVKGYAYPRYFFSNRSADIRALFVWAAALVEVDCRQANARNIAVSRRESIAILDRLVGPKA